LRRVELLRRRRVVGVGALGDFLVEIVIVRPAAVGLLRGVVGLRTVVGTGTVGATAGRQQQRSCEDEQQGERTRREESWRNHASEITSTSGDVDFSNELPFSCATILPIGPSWTSRP